MENSTPSINQVLANPELMNHDNCWSFYDWFCKDETLEKRARKLLIKVKFLVNEGILDGDNCYVWFKNNCPMSGSLYDDIRISTLDDDNDFLGGFCPKTGHRGSDLKASFWIIDKTSGLDMNDELNWSALKHKISSNENGLKDKLSNHFNPQK